VGGLRLSRALLRLPTTTARYRRDLKLDSWRFVIFFHELQDKPNLKEKWGTSAFSLTYKLLGETVKVSCPDRRGQAVGGCSCP